jgi:hypothetical protein
LKKKKKNIYFLMLNIDINIFFSNFYLYLILEVVNFKKKKKFFLSYLKVEETKNKIKDRILFK